MIQANELKIGNWINLPAHTQPQYCRITGIGSKTILDQQFFQVDKGKDHPILDEQIYPIPLTPEILEKAGFEKRIPDSENINSFRDKNNVILNTYKSDIDYYWLYPALWHPNHKIKYVHQLQNLYFSLTGTELNIEL